MYAASAVSARLLDLGADGVELATELLDVLLGEVGVLLATSEIAIGGAFRSGAGGRAVEVRAGASCAKRWVRCLRVQSPTATVTQVCTLLVGLGVLVAVAQVAQGAVDEGQGAGVADAHPAAVGHPDAGLLAGLQDGGGAVGRRWSLLELLERRWCLPRLRRRPGPARTARCAGSPRRLGTLVVLLRPRRASATGPQAHVSRSRQSAADAVEVLDELEDAVSRRCGAGGR